MSGAKRTNSSREAQFSFGHPLFFIECMWAELRQLLDESVTWTSVTQQVKSSVLLNKKITSLEASWTKIEPSERAKLSSRMEVEAAVDRDDEGLPSLIKRLREGKRLDVLLERFDALLRNRRERKRQEDREKALSYFRKAYRVVHSGSGACANGQVNSYARTQLDELMHGVVDKDLSSDSDSEEDDPDNELLRSDKQVRSRLPIPEMIIVGTKTRWWRCTPKDDDNVKLEQPECSGIFWKLGKQIAADRTWEKVATSSSGELLFLVRKGATTASQNEVEDDSVHFAFPCDRCIDWNCPCWVSSTSSETATCSSCFSRRGDSECSLNKYGGSRSFRSLRSIVGGRAERELAAKVEYEEVRAQQAFIAKWISGEIQIFNWKKDQSDR